MALSMLICIFWEYLGDIPGEFDLTMDRILARRSQAGI